MNLKAQQPLVGLVGWRGMVGSVLMDRMQADIRDPWCALQVIVVSTSARPGAPVCAERHCAGT